MPVLTDSHRPTLDIEAAAAYVGVSSRTLHRLAADGRIARHRLGPRLVRFALADLDAFLAASRVEVTR